jgi:hypothetical protein
MGGIYEICRGDGLRCHDIHTRINKDWFRHLKIDSGEYTNKQAQRQHGDA